MVTCPTSKEKHLYSDSKVAGIAFLGTLSAIFLLSGMFFFLTSDTKTFLIYFLFVLVNLFYFSISYFIVIFGSRFSLKEHLVTVYSCFPSGDEIYRPSVDIYYPTCGEPLELQVNALNHIIDLQKHYGINCNIYCLDDSKTLVGFYAFEKVKHRTANIHYLRREDVGYLKKAGNLANAFHQTTGSFIAIFDADFCPRPEFLDETIPYMLKEPSIGIVQTPQYFSLKDCNNWIDKGAAWVQEIFYRLIQVARNKFTPICVGTNALYRRSALDTIAGFAQVGHSEDVRTGFRLLIKGFKTYYIPVILAKGLCPDTLPSFFLQQHRWAMGSMDLLFSKEFWKAKITKMQRLSFLSGMFYYVSTGLGSIFIYIPNLYLLVFSPDKVLAFNYLFIIPSFLFGTIYLAYWTKAPWGLYSLKIRIVQNHAHLFAFYERLTNNITPWQASGIATKTKLYSRFQTFIFWKISIITFTTLICVFGHYEQYGVVNFIPTLFFCLLNYYLYVSILRDQI